MDSRLNKFPTRPTVCDAGIEAPFLHYSGSPIKLFVCDDLLLRVSEFTVVKQKVKSSCYVQNESDETTTKMVLLSISD